MNGANWPSELLPVKRKRKPPGMCRGQHAIYLGYGWFLKLARGTSTHTHMLTHKHTLKILLPFASNAKAHLCSLASNTNTLQKFFFSIFPFLFLEAIQAVLPLRLKSLTTLFMCPFLASCFGKKAPPRQKKLASLHPALQLARQPFGSPRCSSHSALYIRWSVKCIRPLLQLELGL